MTIPTDLHDRRGKMRRLLSRIFDQPVEIAFSSELNIEIDPGVAGLAGPTLGSLLRECSPDDFIEHRATMLVCDAPLRELDPVTAALMFDSVVLHESAHLATEHHVPVDVPTAPLTGLIQAPLTTWPVYATGTKWITHDCRFIRALIHLGYRLEAKKCRVVIQQAFDHKRYGLSPIEHYIEALGGEPEEHDLRPLRELLARPMPDEFMKLWGRDVATSLGFEPR